MASKPCLPVSRGRKRKNNNTNSNGPIAFDDISTMDASEYLSRVVQQSKRLPEVLVKPKHSDNSFHQSNKRKDFVPIEGSAASLSYLVSDRTAIVPPPTDQHTPRLAQEWVDQTLANFSHLRTYLDRLHQNKDGRRQHRQPVPPLKDRPGWHVFCLGEKEAEGNVGSYFADDDENQEEVEVNQKSTTPDKKDTNHTVPDKEDEEKEPWRNNLPDTGYEPTTRLLLQLDQVMVRRVIAHLAHYVEQGYHPCSAQRSLWLYSLLARLEKPVHRNDAAVLFGLLKALTQARVNFDVDKDREGLARLNTLIVIVGLYFEQGGGFTAVMGAVGSPVAS